MGDRYSRCRGCQRWVPRDEMLSFHTDVYDAQNVKTVIRQRYCPACAVVEERRLRSREWDHVVVEAAMLAPLPDGSAPTDDVIGERLRSDRQARVRDGWTPPGGVPVDKLPEGT